MIRATFAAFMLIAPLTASAQSSSGAAQLTSQQAGASIDALAGKAARLPADRRASLVASLRALGPAAVDVMIQRAETDSASMAALRSHSPAAHDAFVAAILDALGAFRSPRAEPMFKRVLERAESPSLVARMAAEGLGRICTPSSISTLASHARSDDARAIESANGLGLCRTASAASVLTTWLASRPPPETTRAIALALGMMGSSWAWEALGPARADEGRQLRSAAAAALIAAYPGTSGEAAHAIVTAILMVDEPSVDGAIRQLPEQDPLRVRWQKLHRK